MIVDDWVDDLDYTDRIIHNEMGAFSNKATFTLEWDANTNFLINFQVVIPIVVHYKCNSGQ